MKIVKRLFFFLFGLLFLLIAGGFLLTWMYKDEIIAKVKEDINKNVNGVVDFGEVNLSIIKSFPDFNFAISDFSITGIEQFEGVKLIQADAMDFSLDIMSVIKTEEPIEIHTVNIQKPAVHVKILPNGQANYDIAKDTSTTEETYNFVVQLEKYTIEDGNLIYDDQLGDMYLEFTDLDHEGKGNFTQDIYDIVTLTKVESIIAQTGGIRYLNKAKGNLDMTLNADMNKMSFTLKENELLINDLKVKADGFVEMDQSEAILMDLNFSTPTNQFKSFLSLIPSAYTRDFKDVKANGQLVLNGMVKGTYNPPKQQLPAFTINLEVKNGDFKYPSLPLGINDIAAKMTINSPASNLDKMTIDVPRFKMKLGQNPFDASFLLKTPISDPDIDAKMNGVIDLAELAKAFPMEGVKTLNGVITTNMTTKTKMSYIDKQDYENVDMSGALQIENMQYTADGMPPIKIKEMKMAFTPRNVKVDNFDAQLGASDLKARGTVDNILAYFSPEKTMTGNLVIRSDFFNANEWLTEETAAANQTPATESTAEVFDRFDFTIDAIINKISYDIYELKNVIAKGQVTPNTANINNFKMVIGNSDIQASGNLNNIFDYLYKNETLRGDIVMSSKFLDMNQFMVETPEGAQAKTISFKEEVALEPVVIPKNVNMNIKADIDELRYTNIDLKKVKGRIVVEDQVAQLKDCETQMLGGTMNMNGSYNSKNAEKPLFDLDYDIKNFQFKTAFEKFNTIQKLAPISKYIDGNFNTTLKMKGALGKDMYPDLNSLTADGFIHTLNGIVQSFKPLEELGNKLNLDLVKKVSLKDTKNWFALKDGKVVVKEFDQKFQDIAMKISGEHGLNQEMNYLIKTKIPRDILNKNAVGQAANKGLDFITKEASKLGVNINQGDFIDLDINILGSITSPKIKITPTGSGGKTFKETAGETLKDIKDKAIEDAKKKLADETEKVKDEVTKKVEDEVKKQVDKTKEQVKDKVKDEVKDEVGKKVEETLGEDAKKEADKLKDKVKDLNPFKKKKKKKEGDS